MSFSNVCKGGFALLLGLSMMSCSQDRSSPLSPGDAQRTAIGGETSAPPQSSVFATGLNNPRGLRWSRDGRLFVAEAGLGGSRTTERECEQVPAPFGPYSGGLTAGISVVDHSGTRTTVSNQFPSAQTTQVTGGDKLGVADITYKYGEMYALIQGGGCSHGNPDFPNGVVRFNESGNFVYLANLSEFYQNNPVRNPEPDDFEPDGSPYSMVRVGRSLYVVEANHGEIDRIDTVTGQITRVVDISASQGHVVPTAITYYKGFLYVGNLTTAPFTDGTAKVWRVDPVSGQMTEILTNLTTVLGLTFDVKGRLYVLETSTTNTAQPPFFNPNSGKVLRIDIQSNTREEIATGLNFPTGMTIGQDGNIYVSTCGFGCTDGGGEITKITLQEPAVSLEPVGGGV